MSLTLVECDNKPMLDGFCVAVNFFNEEVAVTRGKGLHYHPDGRRLG